jgi:hypothetical protein
VRHVPGGAPLNPVAAAIAEATLGLKERNMDLFDVLLGGGTKRQEYEDFARRYDEGPPWEGYSDREVMDRYGEVSHKLPAEDYEAAVRDALSRLSPAEQGELLRTIQERTGGRDAATSARVSGAGRSGGLDDLVRSVQELHEEPGRLRQVLAGPSERTSTGQSRIPGGFGTGAPGIPGGLESIIGSPLGKAALAGITAMLVRRMLRPR